MSNLDEEYGDQRQACESHLAYAAGRGCEIYMPDDSEIFKCPYLYGYEQENNVVVQARHERNGLKNGLAQLKIQLDEAKKRCYEQEGAIKACDKFIRLYK
jgi:hypothetical protein